jgi:hypothetical protein
MLHWYQVWKHMHELTGKDIEKRAIMEIICYLERLIDDVIRQCLVEFRKLNDLRKVQGLHSKMRIDQECVREAIKTLNVNNHTGLHNGDISSQAKGGSYERIGEKNVLHPPKKENQGVEIR